MVRKPKFVAAEPIRIVPLHYPKESLAAEAASPKGKTDLFGGSFPLAPPHAQLTYRGGPLLRKVEVFTIFWGAQWSTSASAKTIMSRLGQFFADILGGPLLEQLDEYSRPGKTIGHGSFIGTKVIKAGAPVGSVTDSQIRTVLAAWIKSGTVPKETVNTLYFIYLEPGVVAVMGGSKSCQNFCGYHDHAGNAYYGVLPYPTCRGCRGGLDVFDALTATSSHELCEAITDPVPGKGWYDDQAGEIGDVCAWSFKKIAGYTVQLEWSNARGKCA
jgi:hypothetical protein